MKKKDISQILLKEGLITAEQLAQAQGEASLTKTAIEKILINKGFISAEDLAIALAKQLDILYMKISDQELSPQVVNMISVDTARQHKAIPVKSEGNTLFVALVEPWDLPSIEEIKLTTGFEIKPVAASQKEIEEAINRYYRVQDTSKQTLVDMRFDKMKEGEKESEKEMLIDEEMSGLEDIPIVRLLNDILQGAVNSGASDIHLEPQFPEMVVRYRVDGMLHDIMTIPKQVENSIISRIKVMANMDITERRRSQDGHVRIQKANKDYDIRISTVLTVNGENVVMRILDRSSLLLNLDKLGLNESDAQVFRSLISKPYGMLLVTGPTGSGKTTTLYAVLSQLDSQTRNVITIEEPVEYHLDRVTQIQVDPGAKISFASGLRTILRQDPDIIMVGEIRDKETADIAVQAALTGHLVLSTLHTNDAASVITRLIDMGVEPFLVSSTVIGMLAQRLCRKVCSECKEEYKPSSEEQKALKELGVEKKDIMLARGKGCQFCYQTGFKGRTGIYEVMEITDEIRKLIIERRPKNEIVELARKQGMHSLQDNAIQKVLEKVTTLEEIKRVVYVD